MIYRCDTCGERVTGLTQARKHAKQGRKTQRDAFTAGVLHSLTLDSRPCLLPACGYDGTRHP